MSVQLDIFSTTPEPLSPKDAGIQKAVDHANQVHPSWSDRAYEFLLDYAASISGSFMAEEVRNASAGIIPEPPSRRAWGAVIIRAARAGVIRNIGYRKVSNERAHSTPAALWRRA